MKMCRPEERGRLGRLDSLDRSRFSDLQATLIVG